MEDVIPLIPAESEFYLKSRAQRLLKKWVASLDVQVIPFNGQTKPLPFEVLRSIMACNITYSQARIVARNRDLQYVNWRKEVNDILACLFVAKDWSLAAKDILYRGKIFLRQSIIYLYQYLCFTDRTRYRDSRRCNPLPSHCTRRFRSSLSDSAPSLRQSWQR